MGIFTRVKAIVNSSVNSALDVIESPESEVDQVVRDMEKGCLELKKSAASSIANVKMLERQMEANVVQQSQWQKNAEAAVSEGNDDIARKALEKRASFDQRIELLTSQLADAKSLADTLKEEYKKLEDKLAEAKIKRDTLVAKKRAADAKKKMFDTSKQMSDLASSFDVNSSFDKMSKYEDDIAKQLAEIEAMEELSDDDDLQADFSKLDRESSLDAELTALKEKVK